MQRLRSFALAACVLALAQAACLCAATDEVHTAPHTAAERSAARNARRQAARRSGNATFSSVDPNNPNATLVANLLFQPQDNSSTGASTLGQLINMLTGEVTAPPHKTSALVEGHLVWVKPGRDDWESGDSWLAKAVNQVRPVKLDGMEEMVTTKGYPLERHDTITTDGYKIVNFRIPHGRNDKPGLDDPPRPPVLLLHGISLASTCWVINQPDESLAFILADNGYDVWMMNTRGNTFSNEHVRYQNRQSRYWAFSADQMALMDLPATLEYIQQTTGFKQMGFVGHSQGGALLLMLLARMPHYNQAISINVNIAPVVHAKYILSPVLVSFFRSANLSIASSLLPPQEFFFMSKFVQNLFLDGTCQIPVTVPSCVMATEAMFGVSMHINTLQYKKMWQQWPSSTSYWNALQWAQMYNEPDPKYMAFNYGAEYNLSAVTAPTVLFSGGRDVLAAPKDIALTREKLKRGGCLVGDNTQTDYSHMDFIWATGSDGARSRLYPKVLDALRAYPVTQPRVAESQGQAESQGVTLTVEESG